MFRALPLTRAAAVLLNFNRIYPVSSEVLTNSGFGLPGADGFSVLGVTASDPGVEVLGGKLW